MRAKLCAAITLSLCMSLTAAAQTGSAPSTSSGMSDEYPGSNAKGGKKAGTGGAGQMQSTEPGSDQDVLTEIHMVNETEIQAGNIAKTNASSKQVKDFAEMLVRDHTKADKQVMSLAKSMNIELPSMSDVAGSSYGGSGSSTQHDEAVQAQQTLDRLKGMKGAEFDREFLSAMVQGHERAIAKLMTAQAQHKGDEIGKLIGKLLPTIKKHLETASRLQEQLGGGMGTGGTGSGDYGGSGSGSERKH
jgi:putative membrane protein